MKQCQKKYNITSSSRENWVKQEGYNCFMIDKFKKKTGKLFSSIQYTFIGHFTYVKHKDLTAMLDWLYPYNIVCINSFIKQLRVHCMPGSV